jgi:hypothetical protein
MHELEPHLCFLLGLAMGVFASSTAKTILRQFGYRSTDDHHSPKKIEVAFPRETLNGIAQAVAVTVVDAIHNHIEDLRVPSKN